MLPFRDRRVLRLAVLLPAALLVFAFGFAGAEETWPAAPDVAVRYEIDATLTPTSVGSDDDEEDRTGFKIIGSQKVTWRNSTQEPAPFLYLHLYANAFRHRHTTLLSERSRYGRRLPDDMQFGGVDVLDARFTSGEQLTLEYVAPEDGNPADRTVAKIELPRPVRPGEKAVISLDFVTTLPTLVRRMGHHEGFVMAAQWYPKLGRYLGTRSEVEHLHDGWACHQYHETTEFDADFADYDVTLRVPPELTVGATGDLRKSQVEGGLRVHEFEAGDVVDFAWTAHARFEKHVREVKPADPQMTHSAASRERRRLERLLGLREGDIDLPRVKIELLLQPEHADQAERHLDAAETALGFFGAWFGPYPYETLTIVDPAFGAGAASGMEYPQLITAGTAIGKPMQALEPEHVIIHEVGHQWFMNLLASDEAREAWLDEGLTTYFTGYFMDLAYGPGVRHDRIHGRPVLSTHFYEFPGVIDRWPAAVGLPEWARPPKMPLFEAWVDLPWLTGLTQLRYHGEHALARRPHWLRQAGWDAGVQPGWEYHDRGSYSANVYSRATLFLHALRRKMTVGLGETAGEKAFVSAMRQYAHDFRWKHPRTDDLLGIAAKHGEFDANAFADALFRTSGLLDYAVHGIRTTNVPDTVHADGKPDEMRQVSEIVVRRLGPVVQPMVLEVCRDDEPDDDAVWERLPWDGAASWERFVVEGKVTAARLDPDGVYLLDVDRSNNSHAARANHRPAAKWGVRLLVWLENAFLSYGRFF